MSFEAFDKGTPVFDGKAVRKQVTVYFSPNKNGPKMDLLIYLPAKTTKPVPLFFQLSFTANSNAGLASFVSLCTHSRRFGTAGIFTSRFPTSGRSTNRSNVMSSAGNRLIPRHFEYRRA